MEFVISRYRRSEQRWLRIVTRIHGVYDKQRNRKCAKFGGNRKCLPCHYSGR